MPPKGSKRSHPYNEVPRQSTRKQSVAKRRQNADPTQEASGNEAAGNQVAPEVIVNEPQPQPSTSQSVNQNVPDTSQSLINDSTASQSVSAPNDSRGSDSHHVDNSNVNLSVQQNSNVTRQEFNQLSDSMNSIKNMFNTFMATFKPGSNVPNVNDMSQSGQPQSQLPFGLPASVPISSPIVSQPSSTITRDPNMRAAVQVSANEQAANDIVQQAVQEHIRTVSDGRATGKNDTDRISYQLDRKIPQSVMQDIWEDRYVDLELLVDKKDNSDSPMVMKSVHSNEFGQVLQLVKAKQPKGIVDIAQWSKAFDVYISIYTRKYYHQTPNLLTYSHKVKELASKGGDFLRYDEEFRKARARFSSPWEVPDLELLVDCNQAGLHNQILKVITTLQNGGEIVTTNSQPFPSDPTPQKRFNKHPPGYCYTYHNNGRCGRTNCKFSHKCYNTGCNKTHSVFTCPLSPNSGLNDNVTDFPGSGNSTGTNTTTTSSSHSSSSR